MSDGSEFQVRGAATENAGRASSLRVLGTVISGKSELLESLELFGMLFHLDPVLFMFKAQSHVKLCSQGNEKFSLL